MESKTASAMGVGIVSVVTPLVFPAIPLPLGLVFYGAAAALFVYAGRDSLRGFLPAKWKGSEDASGSTISPVSPPDIARNPDEGPAELTYSLIRRLVGPPISPKTLQVLRFIAGRVGSEFHLKDAVAAVDGAEGYLDLRGVWAGLTRRTRKILSDPTADLIWWHESGIYDEQGNYVDHVGDVAPLTHSSLRRYFKID